MIHVILKWLLVYLFVLGTLPVVVTTIKEAVNMSMGRCIAVAAVAIADAAIIVAVTLWWQA